MRVIQIVFILPHPAKELLKPPVLLQSGTILKPLRPISAYETLKSQKCKILRSHHVWVTGIDLHWLSKFEKCPKNIYLQADTAKVNGNVINKGELVKNRASCLMLNDKHSRRRILKSALSCDWQTQIKFWSENSWW